MIKSYPSEIWKEVHFNFEFTNPYRLQVSNFGRLKTFNRYADGKLLQGSMVNGYRIIRLKFFTPRTEANHTRITSLQQQIVQLNQQLKALKQTPETPEVIEETVHLLTQAKKNLSKQFKIDSKDRTINYQMLTHKLVAEYFCEKPTPQHTIVAHVDFDKLNNRSSNLKWMTPTENIAHQQKSPLVIAGRNEQRRSPNPKIAKLTVTKVMFLKKLLNEGKPLQSLVKQFKVTDTQILRIKRGENWAGIEAAK